MNKLIDGFSVSFDECDMAILEGHAWHVDKYKLEKQGQYYFYATIRCERTSLHREISGCKKHDGLFVDHRNGDTLDCTRENLRICTKGENVRNQKIRKDNTSGFKWVHWDSSKNSWRGDVYANGKRAFRCRGKDKAAVYERCKEAAVRLHGEFAKFE